MPSQRATAAQRSLRARAAAYALHAQTDSAAHTAPARARFLARFEEQVDPHGELDPRERSRRAHLARKAYFTTLALKSSQARSRRAPTTQASE